MRSVAAALVHHPVLDREGRIVTTAITNLDLHDIARSAYTYGLERYYVVHPIAAQRELAERVREHWLTGSGARRIPDRVEPMRALRVVDTLERACSEHGRGQRPELWATGARPFGAPLEHAAARSLLEGEGPPVLILFGTGWGLAPELRHEADRSLAPIVSPRADAYNHLSVRAAAAILFDRLLAPARGA